MTPVVPADGQPTLRQLVADPSLDLRLLAGSSGLDRAVRWVALTELLDPTPYLRGGEVVLTSGKAVPVDDPDQVDAYVRRLVQTGSVALCFGVQRVHETVPASLLHVAAEVGLPVLEVPQATSFATIGRAVTEMVAAAERRSVQAPFDAQRRLLNAARRFGRSDRVADETADLLDGAAALLEPDGGMVHATADATPEFLEAVRREIASLRLRGAQASASFPFDAKNVGIYPSGGTGDPSGYLAVTWPDECAALARSVVPVALTLVTLTDEQRILTRGFIRQVRSRVAELLQDHALPAACAVADLLAELGGRPGPLGPLTVLVIRPEALIPDQLREELADTSFTTSSGGDLIVFCPPGVSHEKARARLEATGAIVGGASTVPLDDLAAALARARRDADRVAGADGRRAADIAALVDPRRLQAWARSIVAPIEGLPPAQRDPLLATLQGFLARHGQLDPTARALGVHRHTVRNRIQRVEELLGLSLADPETRAGVLLALRHR